MLLPASEGARSGEYENRLSRRSRSCSGDGGVNLGGKVSVELCKGDRWIGDLDVDLVEGGAGY